MPKERLFGLSPTDTTIGRSPKESAFSFPSKSEKTNGASLGPALDLFHNMNINGFKPAKKSPYSSPMITFKFGKHERPFYIPQDFLQNSDWIDQTRRNLSIQVPQIPEDVGHVIIHFMYTGNYQMLEREDYDSIFKSKKKDEFQMALMVFFASEIYHLPGLNTLAKSEIVSLREAIPTLSMLQAIDAVFAEPNFAQAVESKKWLKVFLTSQLKMDFKKKESTFDKTSMIHFLFDIDLVKTVASSLTDIYYERIKELNNEVSELKFKPLEKKSGFTFTSESSPTESTIATPKSGSSSVQFLFGSVDTKADDLPNEGCQLETEKESTSEQKSEDRSLS